MTEPLFEAHEHPPVEALAGLAASRDYDRLQEDVVRHLAQCRRCMGTYAEFVATHLRASTEPEEVPLPSELLDLGMAIPAAVQAGTRATAPPRRRWRFEPVWGVLGAVAVAALLLVGRASGPRSVPSRELRQALAEPMRNDAQGSLLYSDELLPRRREIRGGNGSESVDPALLEKLVQQYNGGGTSSDVAYWLVAAYLTTNQVSNADTYLRDALERFPNETRFHNLAAILSYKLNDPPAAEAHLRTALALDRAPVLLVNLAILRHQQGAEVEAQALLREVLEGSAAPGMKSFARKLAAENAP